VLSVRLFGFSGVSLFLPQVLARVASVVLLFHHVRRVWGNAAGLTASLALTVTPISAVTNRNNTMGLRLLLVLLLALCAAARAAEGGKLHWLLLSAGLVGLDYNIKMLQAYPVAPGFALAYLLWRQ
jgi:4-amino-4-deoxy-L-arabinose transferase-like glycosyltransferase